MSEQVRLAVLAVGESDELRARAEALAARLALPLADGPKATAYDLLLAVTGERLELREVGPRSAGPVCVDFVGGRLGYRRGTPRFGAATLLRAVGFRRPPWRVCDATAGLARDAFLMALAGCSVTAVERSGVLAALVADALERAGDDRELGPVVRERFKLVPGEARQVLADWPADEPPDAVYLDPMFPPRKKSALVKIEMRVCRRVAGADADAAGLLKAALKAARSRVVVKRALADPPLRESPSFSYRGRTLRYDIYLPAASGGRGDETGDRRE